jgi:hypothetical protein
MMIVGSQLILPTLRWVINDTGRLKRLSPLRCPGLNVQVITLRSTNLVILTSANTMPVVDDANIAGSLSVVVSRRFPTL